MCIIDNYNQNSKPENT